MKFIVKPHAEVFVKSDSVRKRFIKILECNLRNILKSRLPSVAVINRRFHIEVKIPNDNAYHTTVDVLTKTPGIQYSLQVLQSEFTTLHDIFEQVKQQQLDRLVDKTFSVRVKRRGRHDFNSSDVERYVGGGLNQAVPSAKVQLKDPDVLIQLEIDDRKLNQVVAQHKGLGGFPLGTQEEVLSLISGGYDSGVSSFLHIKRGSKTHYCFFNLGGSDHEIGVKKMAYHLWHQYGSSAKVKFVTVPFQDVVAEILNTVESGQMGVVLKRMFVRAASQLAEKWDIQALITGEALGQVSSQTLTNLRVIDQVADRLILRPLIHWDKDEIIAQAREIGTEEIAKHIPEYCGVISKSPTVKADLEKLAAEEANFDWSILEQAVAKAQCVDIRDLPNLMEPEFEVTQVVDLKPDDIVIDIRKLDELEAAPLQICNQVIHIPFYKLQGQSEQLDRQQNYALYCEQGVMSQLQAQELHAQGVTNVQVYRPDLA